MLSIRDLSSAATGIDDAYVEFARVFDMTM